MIHMVKIRKNQKKKSKEKKCKKGNNKLSIKNKLLKIN